VFTSVRGSLLVQAEAERGRIEEEQRGDSGTERGQPHKRCIAAKTCVREQRRGQGHEPERKHEHRTQCSARGAIGVPTPDATATVTVFTEHVGGQESRRQERQNGEPGPPARAPRVRRSLMETPISTTPTTVFTRTTGTPASLPRMRGIWQPNLRREAKRAKRKCERWAARVGTNVP
jgi:hypothetical protein